MLLQDGPGVICLHVLAARGWVEGQVAWMAQQQLDVKPP